MTRDELAQAGRALYGERWQSPLARDLGVSDRTMRRWISGGAGIPPGILAEARELLKSRLALIKSLLR